MVKSFISKLETLEEPIHEVRQQKLDNIAELISQELDKGRAVVKFICTHNSRRSQLAEFMLDIFAKELGLDILSLSAGTEATSFEPRMVKAIMNEGFDLLEYGTKPNPLYVYRVEDNDLYYFSKKYDEELLDYGEAIIITVCDHAGETCPVIPSTKHRLHLPYKDPKAYDGTVDEAKAYAEKVVEIGNEMYFLVQKIHSIRQGKN